MRLCSCWPEKHPRRAGVFRTEGVRPKKSQSEGSSAAKILRHPFSINEKHGNLVPSRGVGAERGGEGRAEASLTTFMMNAGVREFEKEYRAGLAKQLPDFSSGDRIIVHVKIREGDKERVQQFQGTVLQRRNMGTSGETFTVRKVSGGISVERIFPLLSPSVDKIEVLRRGKVRRERLFYLRKKVGKAARIKEKLR